MSMLTNTFKWAMVSATAGVVTYYCEWVELFRPGTCNHGLCFTLVRIYALPLLLAAILGYCCPRRPLVCWLFLMVPSWALRTMQLALSAMSGSNLATPVIWVDALHLLLTAFITWVAAIGRNAIGNRRAQAGVVNASADTAIGKSQLDSRQTPRRSADIGR